MALTDIINVTITNTTVGVTQAGFGIPLVLSANATFPERVRFYTDIVGAAVDFATTTPEYKALSAIFAQSPRPVKVAVGRLALKPTQKYTITPTAADNTAYKIRVGAVTFTFTSGAGATATTIVTGLIAAINAGTDTLTATGTTTLVLTGNAAGSWDAVEILDPNLLNLMQDHVDPGVATDLNAILLADNTWYQIINPWNSQLMALAIAAWAEANKRTFVAATQDTQTATTTFGAGTDVMKVANTSAYTRSMFIYHPANDAFVDAAWAGRALPLDPGSETWAFKRLAGVPAVNLSATQRTNIMAKKGNIYVSEAGVAHTEFGQVSSGEWFDVIRLVDWTQARMQERIFAMLVGVNKVPYTDEGVAMIGGQVESVLQDGVSVGGYASYKVTLPKVKDAAPADKAARLLRNVNFQAVLAGAIHLVYVNGQVSV